jgi:hypothetical protein
MSRVSSSITPAISACRTVEAPPPGPEAISKDLRPVHTAATEAAALPNPLTVAD